MALFRARQRTGFGIVGCLLAGLGAALLMIGLAMAPASAGSSGQHSGGNQCHQGCPSAPTTTTTTAPATGPGNPCVCGHPSPPAPPTTHAPCGCTGQPSPPVTTPPVSPPTHSPCGCTSQPTPTPTPSVSPPSTPTPTVTTSVAPPASTPATPTPKHEPKAVVAAPATAATTSAATTSPTRVTLPNTGSGLDDLMLLLGLGLLASGAMMLVLYKIKPTTVV